ncbi:phosphoribosyl-ATP diphosphatase [Sabulicella rubraurantiaca]|uniref:phosphoribosyl-ATP diphosphatase n=1 Tax=Sabulicella rubraurantiaca TaxID=2811429 RepID=UPI001A96B2DC|nr:phosphoribosyl-ATP diphosphatase [Sabulicella rubraurantiaca]
MAKTEKKKAAPKKPKLPLPEGVPTVKAHIPKAVRRAESAHLTPLPPRGEGTAAVLQRLWDTVEQRRIAGDAATSHSARLLKRGTPKVAQKLGEEAVELVIEAVARNREATIGEAADVVYHLLVLLVDAGIQPSEVWGELERREGLSGIVEKASRPKALLAIAQTTKLP